MGESTEERVVVEVFVARGIGRRVQQRHGVHLVGLAVERRIEVGLVVFEERLVGAVAVAVPADVGAAKARKPQRIELDGAHMPVRHAHLHVHGEVPRADERVHAVEPRGEHRGGVAHDGGAGHVHAIGGIFRRGEVVAQHIEDVRATRLVEVRVQRVLGALKIAFENERPGADDAFGVHVVPRRGVLLDVGQSALPVLAVLDGVDAHAAETHRRLQHERCRKLGEIELEQLVHRTGFEEQVGVEAGQRSSHGGLVLEQADGAR